MPSRKNVAPAVAMTVVLVAAAPGLQVHASAYPEALVTSVCTAAYRSSTVIQQTGLTPIFVSEAVRENSCAACLSGYKSVQEPDLVKGYILNRPETQGLLAVLPKLASEVLGRDVVIELRLSADRDDGSLDLVAEIASDLVDSDERGAFEDRLLDRIASEAALKNGLDSVVILQA